MHCSPSVCTCLNDRQKNAHYSLPGIVENIYTTRPNHQPYPFISVRKKKTEKKNHLNSFSRQPVCQSFTQQFIKCWGQLFIISSPTLQTNCTSMYWCDDVFCMEGVPLKSIFLCNIFFRFFFVTILFFVVVVFLLKKKKTNNQPAIPSIIVEFNCSPVACGRLLTNGECTFKKFPSLDIPLRSLYVCLCVWFVKILFGKKLSNLSWGLQFFFMMIVMNNSQWMDDYISKFLLRNETKHTKLLLLLLLL